MTDQRADEGRLLARRCSAGHTTYPGHTVCPECGRDQTDTVDLTGKTATVLIVITAVIFTTGIERCWLSDSQHCRGLHWR